MLLAEVRRPRRRGAVRHRAHRPAARTSRGDRHRAAGRGRTARSEVTARYLVGADGGRSAGPLDLLGIRSTSWARRATTSARCSAPTCRAVMPAVPYVLAVAVAPGAEGLFATTGERDRWIFDIEWHPEAGESLADWPRRPDGRADPPGRRTARSPAGDHRHLPVGLRRVGGPAASVAAGPSWSAMPRIGRRRAARPGMNTGIADGHNLGLEAGLGGPRLGGAVAARLLRAASGRRSAGPMPRRRCDSAHGQGRRARHSPRTSAFATPRVR